MTTRDALKLASHEVVKAWREVKRNVMADPRAAELRQQKLDELADVEILLAQLGICLYGEPK